MADKLFAYVIQSNIFEENQNISYLKKFSKLVIKSLQKCTRNNDLNVYQFINQKKIIKC